MTATMRTVAIRRFGGPEVLEVIEVARPAPGPGEVLVAVQAAGLNGGEVKVRAGVFPSFALPLTLGSEASGIVVAVGANVRSPSPGDEVYGMTPMGAYAEFAALSAAYLAPKPAALDHVHAAALPVAALTAWQGIVELAAVAPGQRVLIHAAGGGVGHIAVQLAKWRGAYVLATARPTKHEFLRDLGVDEPIDHTTTDFALAAPNVDVVVDLVGGAYGPRSLEALRTGGLLLTAAADPGITAQAVESDGKRHARISVSPSGANLVRISELLDSGQLRVHVERTFKFEQAQAAQAERSRPRHRQARVGAVTNC